MQNDRLEKALWLIEQGCSVIPLLPRSKKPCGEVLPDGGWKEFQNRIATREEVKAWFATVPDANIGLVCGAISGVVAVDVDGEKGQAWFKNNMPKPNWWQYTSSKNKFHAFYRHPGNGVRIPPAVKIVEEVDVRGDGSYVAFAPSIHPSGALYTLREMEGFSGIGSLVPVPDIPLRKNRNGEIEYDPGSRQEETASVSLEARESERNSTLTSLCGRMYAKGCSEDEVLAFAHGWNAMYCKPPLPQREVETTVRSMAKTHAGRNPQALNSGGVSRWVSFSEGDFTIADIYRDLKIEKAEDRDRCQQEVRALVKSGVLETCRGRSGWYRKRESALEVIDINAPEQPAVPLWLPFGLHRDIVIQPKNIIIVAGETNSGKTGLLFNLAFMNMHKHPVRYLTSEMTPNEIRSRMDSFGKERGEWQSVEFYERSDNFHDAIAPDGINIIDFLEVHDSFFSIGANIKKVFDALKTGIAVIAIQKRTGEQFGRGGEFTLEKARLGLSLFTHGRLPSGIVGSVKITKAKNFIQGRNPDGKEQFYSLTRGYFYDNAPLPFVGFKRGFWFYPKKERDKIIGEIERYCKRKTDETTADAIEGFYGNTITQQQHWSETDQEALI